jgi:hypothetical protein
MAREGELTGVRRASVIALAILGLVAAGCGGSDGDASGSTTTDPSVVEETTTTTAAEVTTTTVVEPETTETTGSGGEDIGAGSDQEAADAAMLVLDDFVSGWTETPATPEDETQQAERQQLMAACLGIDAAEIYRPDDVKADSPTFVSTVDEQVSSSLTVATSVDDAAFRFATLTSDEAFACIAGSIQQLLAEGDAFAGADVELGEVTVERMSVVPLADESTAARKTMPLVVEGSPLEIYFDTLLVRAGRALISVEAQAPLQPFPVGDLELLGNLVVERVDPRLLG